MKVSSRIVWLQYELKPAAGQMITSTSATAAIPRSICWRRSQVFGFNRSPVSPEEAPRPERQDERDQDEGQDRRVLHAAVRAGRREVGRAEVRDEGEEDRAGRGP